MSREAHAETDAWKAEQQAEHLANPKIQAAIAVKNEQLARRGTYTRDMLTAAAHVHTGVGWHIVVRLNAKSVTVRTWDGTQTIPYPKIDDHKDAKA